MNEHHLPKATIVIFGATGDLAKRKLFPSIYKLYRNGNLADEFAVVGVARRTLTNDQFRQDVEKSIQTALNEDLDLEDFVSHFYYHPLDVTSATHFKELKGILDQLDHVHHVPGNRIFYLAMAPNFFGTIASQLKQEGITSTNGWNRLVIEKPFGTDLASAQSLNKEIRAAFLEEEIYRIDHYLGKEMVRNIEVIRFSNAIFEPLWNNRYIANIQITSSETLGVEDRGGYYDKSGALRDMVQNHMLQMVALLAMEPPIKLTTEEIRSEKVRALRALRTMAPADVDELFVRGQYDGYREEKQVDPSSNTETFVAGKLFIDNFRWAGVPFYIRTGKRMEAKSTKIVIQFKNMPMNLYYDKEEDIFPNLLVIHIQPNEGISIYLNGKKVGYEVDTIPLELDYSTSTLDVMNTPEAYERLLHDCLNGDAANFTHWDEVALSWRFVDAITTAWETTQAADFPNYDSGSWGPKQADELLEQDGFHWWPITK